MTRSTTWLLAGAALSIYAAAGAVVAAEPEQARAQAERDSAAAPKADETRRGERREFRSYRDGEGDRPHTTVLRRGEGRAVYLRNVLQLRPEQDVALKAFVDATSPGGDRLVRFDSRAAGETTTMQRLTEMEARLADQQAATRRRIEATKAFYAQLDERQKKAFDALPMLMMVGPDIGPMMIPVPAPMPVRFEMRRPDFPPERYAPPAPPAPPRPPRS